MSAASVSRRPLIAANWKMNKTRQEAQTFCDVLLTDLGQPPVSVVLFAGFTLLETVRRALDELDPATATVPSLGAQDVHPEAAGAFTGDIAAPQLLDVGCSWVLCGHSERRRDHGERDELVGAKARTARRAGLRPMVCLGEDLEAREADRTFEVLDRQLNGVLDALGAGGGDDPPALALAYEPVWAIGTGKTATPALAQASHAFLRERLEARLGAAAASIPILYGGSVKAGNAAELITQPDVDGFLVGGASLDAASFSAIIANSS
ncbi:MAG: triose-phosphate isomerase [Acidobacteriota bacterium]